ncbi:MAG: acetyl-CoA carboxylase biotin carboxyl carrier protein [Chitinophagaceae bacterium]|jgi:acetyl-CoA carboxylase biotin carboxyl carrier protein|nr:acetyl-CoA carboxylase biotin carboxyl carrier protein [Chitinophagaceae bacterium]
MDLKQIHELIKIINKSNIGEISIEDKDGKVTIKQKEDQILTVAPSQMPQQVYNLPPAAGTAAATAPPPAQQAGTTAPPAMKTDNLITIKSPMIGTFYRKPTPDKPNFVDVGTEIAPGKVVCIIEAMKLFNEIEAEISGKVVKILVDDSSPVEYDQPLFLVEP